MVSSRLVASALTAAAVCVALPTPGRADKAKFVRSEQATLGKACGDGLDEHSACGSCVRVVGAAVTKAATCDHVCLKLPDRLKDANVTLVADASEEDVVSFKPCGGAP